MNSIAQNINLKKIYIKCLIRRINKYRVFFDFFITIETQLLEFKIALIDFKHISTKKTIHQQKKKILLFKLIDKNDKKKIIWNFVVHRQFQLLSMSINFSIIDEKHNLKSINLKITLNKKFFFISDFENYIRIKISKSINISYFKFTNC